MRLDPRTCHGVLMQLSPEPTQADDNNNGSTRGIAKLAFQQKPGSRDTTSTLYKKILVYYKSYKDTFLYFSSASVIGLSGFGESFQVKQLAHQNHAYVVHACLAAHGAHPYPPPPALGCCKLVRASVSQGPSDDALRVLRGSERCAGKTVQAFRCQCNWLYEVQVSEVFESVQNRLKGCLVEFFNNVMGKLQVAGKTCRVVKSNYFQPEEDHDYSEYVNRFLPWYEDLVHPVFEELRVQLRKLRYIQAVLVVNRAHQTRY